MPTMTSELSLRIRTMSFIAIVLVIVAHSETIGVNVVKTDASALPSAWIYYLQHFISHGLSRSATPLFSVISGFLFFLSTHSFKTIFTQKYPKNFKTLLVPYLLWSIWGLCFFYVFQSLPWTAKFFTQENTLLANKTAGEIAFIWLFSPVNYQLWFLRDLILITPLLPIIYYLVHRAPLVIGYVLFSLWAANLNIPWMVGDQFILSMKTLFWFTMGGMIATYHVDFITTPRKSRQFFAVWFILTAFSTYYENQGIAVLVLTGDVLRKLGIVVGLMGIWFSYPVWSDFLHRWISPRWYGLTFFVYLAHEPFITPLKKLFLKVFGHSDGVLMLGYMIIPVFTITFLLWTGRILLEHFPKTMGIVLGGRGADRTPSSEKAV